MWNAMRVSRLLAVSILLLLLAVEACTGHGKDEAHHTDLQAFETFFRMNADSVSIVPSRIRAKALALMETADDSLVYYNYMALAAKTCLFSSDIDSARLLITRIRDFVRRMPPTPFLYDLRSDCANMKGNVFVRVGAVDSAVSCFRRAYAWRMKGTKTRFLPDILMNLADAYNRLGKLDTGAACYRRALSVCDSLQLDSTLKVSIYYGLAQIYVALRDFDQCDHYYNLAARAYDSMLPFEQYFYLNNRGTSYYYRGAYIEAIAYFRRAERLALRQPEMEFELNLSRLNLSDCFLHCNLPDSAEKYVALAEPFFRKIGMATALYYIDTQNTMLALYRKDFAAARRYIRATATPPPGIDPEMLYIRNRNLQLYNEERGDYRRAYHFLQEIVRLDDSIRNERIRMRTADLVLRYQQDSALMARDILIHKQRNEVLKLREGRFAGLLIALLACLIAAFVYLYNKKKRALLLARNHRRVSMLRMENIRNRLSPHFIFNVLNQEMTGRNEDERRELSALVRLMRRNLELAERLCVTLDEELDFVRTYIDLERRSLGPSFHADISVDEAVRSSEVMLPSMLIQVPVENALKHALRDKEGERLLWIKVLPWKNGGISVTITDNGGGFRPQSSNRGTGTGMRVIMQTIQILNQQNKEPIDAEVHNVMLPDGCIGCEVSFHIPAAYDYHM